jgi:hypothetical protein
VLRTAILAAGLLVLIAGAGDLVEARALPVTLCVVWPYLRLRG